MSTNKRKIAGDEEIIANSLRILCALFADASAFSCAVKLSVHCQIVSIFDVVCSCVAATGQNANEDKPDGDSDGDDESDGARP